MWVISATKPAGKDTFSVKYTNLMHFADAVVVGCLLVVSKCYMQFTIGKGNG